MTIAARTGFIGLVTNVACTQAPAGGLREAENVVLRMPGCLEPREGVALLETAPNRPAYGFSLPDTDVYAHFNGGSFAWKEVGGAAIQYTDPVLGATDPQPLRRDVWCHALSRGNTYVPTDSGVLKLLDDASAFESTGIPMTFALGSYTLTATGSWLPATETTAYRLAAVRVDDNGLRVTSIPTGSYSVTNSAGAARGVILTVYAQQDYLSSFDEIEVYRTRNFASGITVDDEMQLVGSIQSSAFTVFAGSVYSASLTDLTAVAARGATLYTSPSRGGIAQQNDMPPAAAAVATYKGSLFAANVRGPLSTVFSYTLSSAALSGTATGVGFRTYTGDVTNGSDQILNLSSTVGLEKGQVVIGTGVPANTANIYITNISGTTVTLSSTLGATAVGASMTFYDAIKVDGQWIPAADPNIYLILHGTGAYEMFKITPPAGGFNTTFVLRSISRAAGSGTIQATHGEEYGPPLPDYDGTPKALTQDTQPGVITWSKKDEPEHFTPGGYAFVGDKGKAILGLVPTRDALFILKEDGVFRLTGSGATEGIASPWRIDPYDPTTFCILPSSVKPLNGRCYFLSQRGVVAFGDGGAELVSLPIADKLRDVIDYVRDYHASNGVYELTGVIGSSAAVFTRESEYLIMRGETEWPLVYNENTRAWTEWRFHSDSSQTYAYRSLFSFERVGRVIHGLDADLYQTRLSMDAQHASSAQTMPQKHDGATSITVNSWDAGTGALTLSGAVTCLQDDVIEDDAGKLWRVTNDVNGSVTVYVDGLTVYPYGGAMAFDTGACVLYRSLRCRVAGATFYGEPYGSKLHTRASAMFSRLQGPVALRFAYASQLTPLTASFTPVGHNDWEVESASSFPLLNGAASYVNGFSGEAVVSNNHARGWLLNVGVRWIQTHGYARLEGVYLDTRPMRGGEQQVSA